MKIYPIHTGNFKLDGGAMYGVVPKQIWRKLNVPDELNLCNWAMRCMLIETGNRLILIDTGIGNKQDAKFLGHYHLNGDDTLAKSLAAHGFLPSQITDVLLTHLHFDHCGGAVVRQGDALIPAFENATYWTNKRHWDWATKPNEREKASFLAENILPLAQSGKLKFIEVVENGIVPFDDVPGFSIRFAFGHTDAMMLPQIKFGEKTLVYMADLLPSMSHIPLPYVMGYDMFPLTTLQEKKAFLQEAADGNYILFFEHDFSIECCTVHQTEKGIRPNAWGELSQFI